MAAKTLFATVGTTKFDALIEELNSFRVMKVLQKKGFKKIVMQVGSGEYIPEKIPDVPLDVEYFRLKPNLQEYISQADLIISHAGAGSCLEALEANKHLLVVVNEELMDNHQIELAEQFAKKGYLFYCNVKNLAETLECSNFSELLTYKKGDSKIFSEFIKNI